MPGMRVLITGGGAAGLAAAVAAAGAGARVTVLERGARIGQKILKTGNGRCNLSNIDASPRNYNAPEFVTPVLSRLDSEVIRGFFAKLGLLTYTDREGRVYPVSNSAASVLDTLRLACERYGVRTVCGFEAADINGAVTVSDRGSREYTADSLVVATGGGTDLLSRAGHNIVPFTPVLCPLATDTAPIRGLSGIRAECAVSLYRGKERIAADRGEVLFRDYGVSGIVIFNLSRFACPGDVLSLDFLPDTADAELIRLYTRRRTDFPQRGREDFLTGVFHSRVNAALCRAAGGFNPATLAGVTKDFRLDVKGPAEAGQAQVTRGGARLDGFDPATLRSRHNPRVFAAGEALNVDGSCGGYNLHWAFASGIAAGTSAAGGSL